MQPDATPVQASPAGVPPARDGTAVWKTLRVGLIGLCLGLAGAAAYIALDGRGILFVPRWAEIVFYPGFFVGFKANEWGIGEGACVIIGVVAIGTSYALLAMLLHKVVQAVGKRFQRANKANHKF